MTTETTVSSRQAVLDELRSSSKFIVLSHENPDGDALGSLIAMQLVLTGLGKDSVMFIAESDFPLAYEYRDFPLDGHVSEPPADIEERTVIFLDCGNRERNALEAALGADARILNIDHHHDNTRFGTVNLVVADASCAAEVVWDLMHALGLEMTPTIAEWLYVGLVTDTGRFMYASTGPRAHTMAAELIEAGVDVHAVFERLFENQPYGKLLLLGRGLRNVERYDDGRLIIASVSAEDFVESGAEESYSDPIINELRSVEGTMVAAVVRDRLEGGGPCVNASGARIRKVSLRSSDTRFDVSVIARAQGGGGHCLAAGFTTDLPWDELVTFLREQIAAQLRMM